jgi:hypothetical protein
VAVFDPAASVISSTAACATCSALFDSLTPLGVPERVGFDTWGARGSKILVGTVVLDVATLVATNYTTTASMSGAQHFEWIRPTREVISPAHPNTAMCSSCKDIRKTHFFENVGDKAYWLGCTGHSGESRFLAHDRVVNTWIPLGAPPLPICTGMCKRTDATMCIRNVLHSRPFEGQNGIYLHN